MHSALVIEGGRQLPMHRVLGIECFVGDLNAAASAVVDRATSRQGGYAVLCNSHVLSEAQRSSMLRQALERAWIVLPDGAPVAWLQRRTGASGARRIGGPDLMPAVIAQGRTAGVRHFFFGSTPAVLSALELRLQELVPGAAIVGAYAPEPGAEHSSESLAAVVRAQPDIVWVALGAPRQELWMRRHAHELEPAVALGVGAAFDFHAGTKQRAPRWVQRVGLEWLHRFASEPRRLGPRYLKTNTAFMCLALQELHGQRTHPKLEA
jgi:N-acetylglucosaminyldiphosphoundecaprenol N-acetyl-beta-D-mannosaminyltransferase